MALPMDEQRILEEMERMLAADDPRLAARLAAFGQPGIGYVLRTRRARATLSLMALVLIATVASVIYMMSALRLSSATPGVGSGQHPTHSGQRVKTGPAAHTVPSNLNAAHCADAPFPDCGNWSMLLTSPNASRASTAPATQASTQASTQTGATARQ